MAKAMINLSPGININGLRNGDLLVYDFSKKEFYVMSQDVLFARYDAKVKEMEAKIEKIEKNNNDFLEKIQESNGKMIRMVKNFIGQGD